MTAYLDVAHETLLIKWHCQLIHVGLQRAGFSVRTMAAPVADQHQNLVQEEHRVLLGRCAGFPLTWTLRRTPDQLRS